MYKERIHKFLLERKRAYSATQIAEYFLCTKQTVLRACQELVKQGEVSIRKNKNTNFYKGELNVRSMPKVLGARSTDRSITKSNMAIN